MTIRDRKLVVSAFAIGLFSIVTAYCRTFSNQNLVVYDDVGMLMIVIRRFFEKRVLYDDLSTIYGPLYYFYEWCAHALTGSPVTHDSVQFVSLFFWVTSALLIFLLVYRATNSLLLATVVHFLTFRALGLIGMEPAHPQELCITLLAVLGLAVCCISNRIVLMISLGALAAAMVATKINLGLCVVIALTLALLAAVRRGMPRTVLLLLAGAAALAFPVLLMWGHHADSWAQKYCFVAVISLAAAIIVVSRMEFQRSVELSDFLFALSGFAATIVAVGWFAVAHGSSVHGMIDTLIFLPQRSFGRSWFLEAKVPNLALPCSLLGLACALLAATRRTNEITVALLKLAFAAGVGFLAAPQHNDAIMSFVPPFIWLVAVGPGETLPDRIGSLPRAILALVVVFQMLYAYPVAGLQVPFTGIMMFVVAAICLSDSLLFWHYRFPGWSSSRLSHAGVLLPSIGLTMLYVLSAGFAILEYKGGEPIGLPGTGHMRIRPKNAALVRNLAGRIDSSPCTMLASAPGLLSFNFLTGKPAPRAVNFSAWMLGLSDAEQEKAVLELSQEPYPCVLYNQRLIDFWTLGADASSRPLVKFMRENFEVVYEASGYRLMEPKRISVVKVN